MSSRYIFAIDPGNERSAYALLDTATLRPSAAGIVGNNDMRQLIAHHSDKDATDFVIEMVAGYGMPVGYVQNVAHSPPATCRKLHICGPRPAKNESSTGAASMTRAAPCSFSPAGR